MKKKNWKISYITIVYRIVPRHTLYTVVAILYRRSEYFLLSLINTDAISATRTCAGRGRYRGLPFRTTKWASRRSRRDFRANINSPPGARSPSRSRGSPAKISPSARNIVRRRRYNVRASVQRLRRVAGECRPVVSNVRPAGHTWPSCPFDTARDKNMICT